MNDLIRAILYNGVGTMVIAKAKFKEFIEELIQNNALTQEEGRRVINEYIILAENKKIAVEDILKASLDKVLLNLKMPPRNELEIKFNDLVAAFKDQTIFQYLKKEMDNAPAVK
ncbi:MAG: hypothetical protein R2728_16965 [Chitinophagales bacterium]